MQIGNKRINTTLTEFMQKKGISSLYFLDIRDGEKELAIKGYNSTLWGYDKAVAFQGKVKNIEQQVIGMRSGLSLKPANYINLV